MFFKLTSMEQILRSFGNSVLRSIFRCKREKVREYWRIMLGEDPFKLYPSLNCYWVTKSSRMSGERHVAL
jgi:hypothetical protein